MNTVPPWDVVAVLCVVVTGGLGGVVVVTDGGGGGGGGFCVVRSVVDGATVVVVPVVRVVAVVGVLDDVVGAPRPVVEVAGRALDGAVEREDPGGTLVWTASASSIAVCDRRATSRGATPLATRPTAAKATVTATTTPRAQNPASSSPRRIPDCAPDRGRGGSRGLQDRCKARCAGPGPTADRPYPDRMAKVLIVEDDDRVRVPLVHSLTTRGHFVTEASRGLPALQSIVDEPPDVVLLDLGLPDIDGGDLLKMLRAVSSVPLIIGTARDEEGEIVRLLDAGADEYIVKPFSAAQVDARIRALLRRTASTAPARVEVGELVIDAGARTASLADEPLELSRKEFDLLLFLARRCGSVVTKQELLAEIWDQPFGGVEKTVDTHLSWLRAKLGESASAPRYLHTVRGVGIKMLAPVDPAGAAADRTTD